MTVVKAISSFGYTRRGTVSHVKTVCVDLPCSQSTFIEYFVNKMGGLEYLNGSNVRFSVAPSDLNQVFSSDWNLFVYRNCQTRRRILGLISLHYRRKNFVASGVTSR